MRIRIKKNIEQTRTFYFSEEDRADENATVVVCRFLPKSLQAQIKDNTLQMDVGRVDGTNKITVAQNTVSHMITLESICGWRNVDSVNPETGEATPLNFDNSNAMKNLFLDSLTKEQYERIVEFCTSEKD